jgi:hypothetical protein
MHMTKELMLSSWSLRMTWNDTDRTELDKYVDEIEENAQQIGIVIGKSKERERIRNVAQQWIDEMLGHDGECNCKHDANVLQQFINHNEFNDD